MNDSLVKTLSLFAACFVGACWLSTSTGCSSQSQPTGPAEGSVQEYLDANPDVAARIDEDESDEEGDDGSGE